MRSKVLPILLLLVGLVVLRNRTDVSPDQDFPRSQQRDECARTDCAAGSLPNEAPPTLSASDACGDVGYLCSDLETETSIRILRWPSDTDRIRIRIPVPPNEDDVKVARALQDAARRGIMKWDGLPFTIVADTRRRSQEPADIVLEWADDLGGNKLGVTRRQVRSEGNRLVVSVSRLALATRIPGGSGKKSDPNQVMLTAAHEMGHALGLPHSNEARDVMYPTNTAKALTNRDYRTVAALYATPNGVEIHRDR